MPLAPVAKYLEKEFPFIDPTLGEIHTVASKEKRQGV
jgi:hypothetical protein